MAENFFLKTPLEAFTDSLSSKSAEQPSIPDAPRNAAKTSSLLPPSDLIPVFEASARQFNVPVNVLMALSSQESSYNKNAIGSPTKWGRAKGIMQYLDGTAKDLGINPFNPDEAIPAAAKQLRERLDKGASLEDAIKEHFAGPDRKLWGDKTHAYGQEVMDRVGKIGDLLGAGDPAKRPDASELQAQLNSEAPGRYQVIDDNYLSNHFSPALPRPVYEYGFKMLNPGADESAVQNAMQAYDAAHAKDSQQKAQGVIDRFEAMKSPEAMFQQQLDKRLAGPQNGILPSLPTRSDLLANYNKEVAKQSESGKPSWSDAGSYLGQSAKAGVYQMAGAAAKLLDEINPWTLSEEDAAVLFKDDPAKLKDYQDHSAAMILSRFANSMQDKSVDAMENVSPGAKSGYGDLRYATTDASKSAFLSPVRVVGDAIQSLPTMAAMAFSAYLTKGAASQAEKTALASGMSAEAAKKAGVEAAARVMANTSAASEGAVGYAQNALQTHEQLSRLPDSEMQKSPMYQELIAQGYSKQAARAKVIAVTSEQSGAIAGIADAAVNKVGGEFLGRIMTEGGKFISRVMKGAATEGVTEAVQSPAEQFGQNFAIRQNVDKSQSLTEGTGEAALQGLAVGGLSGGAFGGIAGHSATETAGASERGAEEPAAQAPVSPLVKTQDLHAPAAPAAQNVETVTPPEPSQAPGPLTQSVENAATQPERVKVSTPVGEVSGFVQSRSQDVDGNFAVRVLGDDGNPYTFTSQDGVQIVPESGPLTAALERTAESHASQKVAAPDISQAAPDIAAQVAPDIAPSQPAAPEPKLEDMTEPELRARMKYLAGQAKNNGGWNKLLMTERRKVEAQINKIVESANGKTSTPNSTGVGADGSADNAGSAGVSIPRDDVGRTGGDGSARAAVDSVGQSGSVLGENRQSSELKSEPAPDEYANRRFSYKEKAEAFIAKNNIGDTHEVVQTGKARFEVKPKATVKESLTAQPENVEAINTSGESVKKSQENVQVKSETAQPAKTQDIMEVKDVYGETHRVRKSDLDGDMKLVRTFTKDGKLKGRLHRDNIDITGEKRAEIEAENADNPMFDVVTGRDGATFKTEAAAKAFATKNGYAESHYVAPASDVSSGATGFILKKKGLENGDNKRTSGEPNGSEAVAGKQAAERSKAGDANANAASEEKAQGKKEVGAANNRTEAERELESIFKGLASRGKKTKQAAEAKVSGHPREAQIRYVEQNFYDLLSELDESGRIKIVC